MITEDYLIAIKVKLLTSPVVQSFTIIKERVIVDRGYFRDRLIWQNGYFCEIVEFFAVQNQTCVTESYRYQWIDSTKQQLRKRWDRWDNVEHFPDLPNFPHHVHILEEAKVYPSQSLNILQIIDYLEQAINQLIREVLVVRAEAIEYPIQAIESDRCFQFP